MVYAPRMKRGYLNGRRGGNGHTTHRRRRRWVNWLDNPGSGIDMSQNLPDRLVGHHTLLEFPKDGMQTGAGEHGVS